MLIKEATLTLDGEIVYKDVESDVTTPPPTSQPVDEVALLKAQLKAQTDRCDFLEDCIAEMAMQVYN